MVRGIASAVPLRAADSWRWVVSLGIPRKRWRTTALQRGAILECGSPLPLLLPLSIQYGAGNPRVGVGLGVGVGEGVGEGARAVVSFPSIGFKTVLTQAEPGQKVPNNYNHTKNRTSVFAKR
jgi:hypothetical protein